MKLRGFSQSVNAMTASPLDVTDRSAALARRLSGPQGDCVCAARSRRRGHRWANHGFVSYVSRNAGVEDMLDMVRRALGDEVICDPKSSCELLRELSRRRMAAAQERPIGEEMTKRERDVLQLLGRRLCNKEIARQPCLSPATVTNHVHAILTKRTVTGRHKMLARLEANRKTGEDALGR